MKIICIGRNYSEHAQELGNEVPAEPVFFLKPDSSILPNKNAFYIPAFTDDVHYEVELVVKINRLGKHIDRKFSHRYYNEIGLGIDFTARDVQKECKKKGLPWEKAKGFDGSAVVSKRFLPLSSLSNKENINFSLLKNNEKVQTGNSTNMIFSIDAIISYVSQFMTLKIGDLIFTGTPKGVGPVSPGDQLTGFLESTEMFNVKIR